MGSEQETDEELLAGDKLVVFFKAWDKLVTPEGSCIFNN